MLARLLEVNNTGDPMGVEETRMRAATLLCKVSKDYSITTLVQQNAVSPVSLLTNDGSENLKLCRVCFSAK